MIYLATPYSHPDPAVREQRFQVVNRAASSLKRRGFHVFSPISHSHPIALAGGLPLDWEYWAEDACTMLSACDAVIVLKQDGWPESVGVKAEIEIAEGIGIRIDYIDVEPEWLTYSRSET